MSTWRKLRDAIEAAWGMPGLTSARSVSPHARLDVYLPLPDGKRVRVGTLHRDGVEVVFRYADEFRKRDDLPPIPDFPEKGREYRSTRLWPFFDQRVPPVKRPDVSRRLSQKQLTPDSDRFVLLAELGRTAVTSPYELEAREPRPA